MAEGRWWSDVAGDDQQEPGRPTHLIGVAAGLWFLIVGAKNLDAAEGTLRDWLIWLVPVVVLGLLDWAVERPGERRYWEARAAALTVRRAHTKAELGKEALAAGEQAHMLWHERNPGATDCPPGAPCRPLPDRPKRAHD